jgi:farnesyl-diphosphate farnesyltransferase
MYCNYVAGTVGQMGTRLAARFYNLDDKKTDKLLELSKACALGLQMTNIFKDFRKDLDRGVCYLPLAWLETVEFRPLELEFPGMAFVHGVVGHILRELQTSTHYITNLPLSCRGMRRASLLCLLPALTTLEEATQLGDLLFTTGHVFKISRNRFKQCMVESEIVVDDNKSIMELTQGSCEKIACNLKSTINVLLGEEAFT